MTTVLTAAGVLIFLSPALTAQDNGSTGQSGSTQSGQGGARGRSSSRSDSSSQTQSGTSSATSQSQSGQTQTDESSQSKSGHSRSGRSESAAGGSASLSSADQKFVKEAAEGGLAEVKLGQLAADKGASDQVKEFGKRMVDDHGKANEELKGLASRKGITTPDQPNAKDQALYDRLSKLSGTEFDSAYMRQMEKDHAKDIAEFQREAQRGQDPDLKQWAQTTLTTLQQHNQMAHETMAHISGESGRGTSAGRGTTTGDSTTTGRTGDQSTSGTERRNPK